MKSPVKGKPTWDYLFMGLEPYKGVNRNISLRSITAIAMTIYRGCPTANQAMVT